METNNKLAVFSNPDFGEVRTLVKEDGSVLFCGKDVAEALGYAKPNNAISAHCRYSLKQGVPHPQSPDKTVEMTFIPESDVYRLAFGSKLESAEKFTDWVVEEVLPSIRKTGAYDIRKDSRELDIEEKKAEAMIADANARIEATRIEKAKLLMEMSNMNISPQASQALVSCASEVLTGIKCIPLPEVDKTYSATEAGEIIGVSAAKIGRVANANGIKTEDFGIFVLDKARESNKQVTTFRYNEKGLAKLRELFSE